MPFIHTNTYTKTHTYTRWLSINLPVNIFCKVFENKEKMVLVMEIAAGGELYDYLRNSEEKTTPMNPKSIIY